MVLDKTVSSELVVDRLRKLARVPAAIKVGEVDAILRKASDVMQQFGLVLQRPTGAETAWKLALPGVEPIALVLDEETADILVTVKGVRGRFEHGLLFDPLDNGGWRIVGPIANKTDPGAEPFRSNPVAWFISRLLDLAYAKPS